MSAPIVFCWVGRTSAEYARVGIADYAARINRYRPCREVVVAQERGRGRFSPEHRVEREGQRILERLQALEPAVVIALAPTGKQVESRQLAAWVQQHAYDEARAVVFVVGGPDGLSSPVLRRADRLLGLSRLTLPHDMARLFLTEQVYRSLTIIEGHPYDR